MNHKTTIPYKFLTGYGNSTPTPLTGSPTNSSYFLFSLVVRVSRILLYLYKALTELKQLLDKTVSFVDLLATAPACFAFNLLCLSFSTQSLVYRRKRWTIYLRLILKKPGMLDKNSSVTPKISSRRSLHLQHLYQLESEMAITARHARKASFP